MHRFLVVPSAPFAILDDPVNQGEFHAQYLQPGAAFLSQLEITNDGLRIEWNPEKVEIWRFPPPFAEGFTELDYRVLESTNINGIAFPVKSVLNRYGISPGGSQTAGGHVGLPDRCLTVHFQRGRFCQSNPS